MQSEPRWQIGDLVYKRKIDIEFLVFCVWRKYVVQKLTLNDKVTEQVRITVNSVHRLGLDRLVVEGSA